MYKPTTDNRGKTVLQQISLKRVDLAVACFGRWLWLCDHRCLSNLMWLLRKGSETVRRSVLQFCWFVDPKANHVAMILSDPTINLSIKTYNLPICFLWLAAGFQ
ncbi:hypothetical protein P8452_37437 [Trifolium repens]|nr:hypothetical protein P8452_37437 [Trifolium repens]